MLRNIEALEKYDVQASDGRIGHVKDFFFDDASWVVRYVVVDTGRWLSDRQVLVSPISVSKLDPAKQMLQVLLTREQVKNSPDIDTDMPVSRQHEMSYLGYYGYPYYWGGNGLWGGGSFPSLMLSDIDSREGEAAYDQQQIALSDARLKTAQHHAADLRGHVPHRVEPAPAGSDDPHLRSCKSVVGHEIQATDGLIGHVCGFLVDEDTWAIRYLVVQTSHWWSGHKVLIVPDWITGVNWFESTVTVALSRGAIKESPPFESTAELDREQEVGLYKHYDRSGYWTNQL
jgi:hypothetical protein